MITEFETLLTDPFIQPRVLTKQNIFLTNEPENNSGGFRKPECIGFRISKEYLKRLSVPSETVSQFFSFLSSTQNIFDHNVIPRKTN